MSDTTLTTTNVVTTSKVLPKPAMVTLEERLEALEAKVEFLAKQRPGRRMKPIVQSKAGVCGLDPSVDSETCPDASIYRYQQGCRGVECSRINAEYYADYRARRKSAPTAEAEVEMPVLAVPNGGTPVESPQPSTVTY